VPNRSFLAAKNPAGNLLLTTKYDIVHRVYAPEPQVYLSIFFHQQCVQQNQ